LTRHSGRTGAAAGFLAAGLTLGLFALSYADRLAGNASDHAAFTAGADLRVAEGPPIPGAARDVLPLDRYARTGAQAVAPAIRVPAETLTEAGGGGAVTLLGLPAGRLSGLPAVRRALGRDARGLARDLEPGAGLTLGGRTAPADRAAAARDRAHHRLGGRARPADPAPRRPLPARHAAPRGGTRELEEGVQRLEAELPRGVAGGRLLGVEVTIPLGFALTEPIGRLRLGTLEALGPAARGRR
jgi:hypothetical protein